jgi:toxin HigB-1
MAITKIKHRGLKELFTKGRSKRIGTRYQANAIEILDFLDFINDLDDCIGMRDFHPLIGKLKGHYAMSVSANYRITFTFDSGNVTIEDFTDYH